MYFSTHRELRVRSVRDGAVRRGRERERRREHRGFFLVRVQKLPDEAGVGASAVTNHVPVGPGGGEAKQQAVPRLRQRRARGRRGRRARGTDHDDGQRDDDQRDGCRSSVQHVGRS